MKKNEKILIGGSLVGVGLLYFLLRCKNPIFMDADIRRDGNEYTSLGGHRIWIPNKYSGENFIFNGKTEIDTCDISKKVITIDIENLSPTINAALEMNCSYGWGKVILPVNELH